MFGSVSRMKWFRNNGKILCPLCGGKFDTFVDRKKHDLAFHYSYVLAQCKGDRKLLRWWASKT